MSQRWHYRCLDDGDTPDDDPHRINHGKPALRALARLGPAIAALTEADTDGLVELTLDGNIVLTGAADHLVGNRAILAWLGQHGTHQLELGNEYGDIAPIDEPCPAELAAVPGVTCERSIGHPGDHEARVRASGEMLRPWTVRW